MGEGRNHYDQSRGNSSLKSTEAGPQRRARPAGLSSSCPQGEAEVRSQLTAIGVTGLLKLNYYFQGSRKQFL